MEKTMESEMGTGSNGGVESRLSVAKGLESQ